MNAIVFLSELTGIPLKNILTFGDDFNDIEMLEKCGLGVAVGNAAPTVKKATSFVCSTNDDDGVANYLERFVL